MGDRAIVTALAGFQFAVADVILRCWVLVLMRFVLSDKVADIFNAYGGGDADLFGGRFNPVFPVRLTLVRIDFHVFHKKAGQAFTYPTSPLFRKLRQSSD